MAAKGKALPAQKNVTDLPMPEKALVGAPAKLGWVQAHVDHVTESGTAHFGAYFQEHGLLALIRPWEAALNFTVLVDYVNEREDGTARFLTARVRMFDNDLGTENPLFMLEALYPNEANNKQGFGYSMALTYAKKYALQKFFSIPAKELPEQEQAPAENASVKRKTGPMEAEFGHLVTEVTAAKATHPTVVPELQKFMLSEFGAKKSAELTDVDQVRAVREHLAALTANGAS